jgi:hypothetical protein
MLSVVVGSCLGLLALLLVDPLRRLIWRRRVKRKWNAYFQD